MRNILVIIDYYRKKTKKIAKKFYNYSFIKQTKKKINYLEKSKLYKEIKKRNTLIFIFAVILLVFASFWRVLTFGFLRDDWAFLWATQYQPNLQLAWNLHPGTKYEDYLFFPFFGWNPFYWQLLGIILRIFASFSISFMLWGFFKSRKISILGGLFFAVSFVGLETVSWRSVHVVALDIIFISIGFYFFAKYLEIKQLRNILFSLLSFAVAIAADPSRVIPVIPLIFSLALLHWWISPDRKIRQLIFLAITLSIMFAVLFKVFFIFEVFQSNEGISMLSRVIQDPSGIKTLFATLGNLLFGWVVPIPELGSLSFANPTIERLAFILLFNITLISFYLVIFKKSKYAMFILIMGLWIVLFYFPNWVFDKNLVFAGTHRYVGISGVGMVIFLAILVSLIKQKYLFLITATAIVILNLATSNRILATESSYREKSIGDRLWTQILHDVPSHEKNSIFMYLGNDYIRGSLLDFSEATPFAVKRKISNIYDIPIPTADDSLILRLMCQKNALRPTVVDWVVQKTLIPLSHVYAWEVNNGKITNVSQRERIRLKEKAEAQGCIVQL